MVVTPTPAPKRFPVPLAMGATNGAELDHEPPGVPSFRVAELPWQIVVGPVIAAGVAGSGFTETVTPLVREHPP